MEYQYYEICIGPGPMLSEAGSFYDLSNEANWPVFGEEGA